MYIGSPSESASYSDSQSSPRNPLCTKRTVVVPDRPSRVNSIACTTPSGPGVPSSAKRCGGSQAVIGRLGDLVAEHLADLRRRASARPRWGRRSTSRRAARRSVSASQTSSGVASISTEVSIRNGCVMSGLLRGNHRPVGGLRGIRNRDRWPVTMRPMALPRARAARQADGRRQERSAFQADRRGRGVAW